MDEIRRRNPCVAVVERHPREEDVWSRVASERRELSFADFDRLGELDRAVTAEVEEDHRIPVMDRAGRFALTVDNGEWRQELVAEF